jgi:hypothetical protein
MSRYNKIRLKVLDYIDGIAGISLLVLTSGGDTTEPIILLKAILFPAVWLLARHFANR